MPVIIMTSLSGFLVIILNAPGLQDTKLATNSLSKRGNPTGIAGPPLHFILYRPRRVNDEKSRCYSHFTTLSNMGKRRSRFFAFAY